MKTFVYLSVLGVLFFTLTWASDDEAHADKKTSSSATDAAEKEPDTAERNKWMKAKQMHAKDIFDGLTEGDFKKIEKSAGMMYASGLLEKWLGDGDYAEHYAYEGQANAFEYSVKELRRFAKQRDVNGALNAYVMMSQSCVRCHSLIRDAEK